MNNKIISKIQVFFIMAIVCSGTSINTFSEIFKLAGRASAIANMTSLLLLIPLALWALRLAQFAPGHTILEILEMTAGKFFSKVACGLYTLISFAVMTLTARHIGFLLQASSLPNTPLYVTSFVLLTLSTFIARGGIEVLGRLCEVLYILTNVIFWLGTFGASLGINFDFLFPVFDRGVTNIAAAAYLQAGSVSEGILLLLIMVAALARPADSYNKAVSMGILLVVVNFASASMLIIGVYGVEVASHFLIPEIQVSIDVQQGNFVQGLEMFVQVASICTVTLGVAAHTYAASVATAKIFNNRYPMVWLAMTFASVAFLVNWIPSFNEVVLYSTLLGRYVTLPFIIIILFITSTGLLFRGRKLKEKSP